MTDGRPESTRVGVGRRVIERVQRLFWTEVTARRKRGKGAAELTAEAGSYVKTGGVLAGAEDRGLEPGEGGGERRGQREEEQRVSSSATQRAFGPPSACTSIDKDREKGRKDSRNRALGRACRGDLVGRGHALGGHSHGQDSKGESERDAGHREGGSFGRLKECGWELVVGGLKMRGGGQRGAEREERGM